MEFSFGCLLVWFHYHWDLCGVSSLDFKDDQLPTTLQHIHSPQHRTSVEGGTKVLVQVLHISPWMLTGRVRSVQQQRTLKGSRFTCQVTSVTKVKMLMMRRWWQRIPGEPTNEGEGVGHFTEKLKERRQAVTNAKYECFVDRFLISAKLADKQLKNKDLKELVLHH